MNLRRRTRPRPATCPSPCRLPTLDEGPHLDYAGQWIIFATLTMIVYPLLLRRTARHKASEKAEADHAPEPRPSGNRTGARAEPETTVAG